MCIYRWYGYVCVHLQETNTHNSTDSQVSAERGSRQFLQVYEQRKQQHRSKSAPRPFPISPPEFMKALPKLDIQKVSLGDAMSHRHVPLSHTGLGAETYSKDAGTCRGPETENSICHLIESQDNPARSGSLTDEDTEVQHQERTPKLGLFHIRYPLIAAQF